MEQTLVQQVNVGSESKPVIAGTSVSVEEILEKLAAGMEPMVAMKACQLKDDRLMDIAVEYAETLTPGSRLSQLMKQYRQQQRQKVERILLQFKQYCLEQYGERLVDLILFGSQARGDIKPSSDIDVLVVLKESVNRDLDREKVLDFQLDVSVKKGELLSCVFMDEHYYQTRQGPLLRNIRREGIRL